MIYFFAGWPVLNTRDLVFNFLHEMFIKCDLFYAPIGHYVVMVLFFWLLFFGTLDSIIIYLNGLKIFPTFYTEINVVVSISHPISWNWNGMVQIGRWPTNYLGFIRGGFCTTFCRSLRNTSTANLAWPCTKSTKLYTWRILWYASSPCGCIYFPRKELLVEDTGTNIIRQGR